MSVVYIAQLSGIVRCKLVMLSGINVGTGANNTFLGHNANVSQVVSGSTAIGYNATCNASNQIIMVGTSTETVVIPGNLTFSQSLNNISTTTFGFLSGITSSIQSQINNSNSNISTFQNKITDIMWTINKTTIYNQCETSLLTFSQSLNSVSATTFGFLSGVTSSIQEQLNEAFLNIYTYLPNSISFSNNELKNQIAPPGSIITYAGTSTTLDGYFLCDGSSCNSSNYYNLFNAIGYTYGGSNGIFKIPNYKGIFLRGNGS